MRRLSGRIITALFVLVFSGLFTFIAGPAVYAETELNSQNRWSEPSNVANSGNPFGGGSVVGIQEGISYDEYASCINSLAREAAIAGMSQWDWNECDKAPYVASCGPTDCNGPISPDGLRVTYTLYNITNNTNQVVQECGTSGDNTNCIQAAGCELIAGGDGMTWIVCPFQFSAVGSLDVDMEKWRNLVNENQSDPVSPSNPDLMPIDMSAWTNTPTVWDSWAQQTVLSDVRTWGTPQEELVKLAATIGASIVLIILVMLPTQLINSTLEENIDLMRQSRRKKKISLTTQDQNKENLANTVEPKKVKKRIPQWLWGIPIIFVAAIMTGFVEPGFGINTMSLRLVLTAFLTFLVLNYVGTVFVWFMLRKRESAALPIIRVHYFYLVIIAVTVLASRLLNFQPALVFGVVLAIEATRVAIDLSDQRSEDKSLGRLQFAIATVTIVLGLGAWVLYNFTPTWTDGLTGIDLTVQEALGAFAIEALTTLPILLLPLRFMPGALIFRWNKWFWAITYAVAMTIFFFVLIPLPSSWATVSTSLAAWVITLVCYALFAVLFWTGFRVWRNLHERT